jgi:hypothetical protein
VARPSLLNLTSCARLEQFSLQILTEGLKQLEKRKKLPRQEDPLNFRLHACCRKAKYDLVKAGQGFPCTLTYEGNNQPMAYDQQRAARLGKRPDFQMSLHDDQAEDWKWSELFFTIECKRLGAPMPALWVLNENYVLNGINRFCDNQWGYARGMPSGAMVGYIQSMDPPTIFAEVNGHGASSGHGPILPAAPTWVAQGVTRLDPHQLNRPFAPNQFTLHHIWADLRHRNFVKVKLRRKKKKK